LATRLDYTRATQISAVLGQAMALLFGFIGFFYNPFLIFIALFVWIGANQEASMVQMKSALGGIPVGRAMVTDFRSLDPQDSLAGAVELILAGSQQDFPVVSDSRVVGILTRSDLLVALAKRDETTTVADVMQRDIRVLDPTEMLETAFARLQACQCRTAPVVQGGKLVGLLTMDNVGEFISIQSALRSSRRRME
jgi:CBS-domain-containing membrane protein